LLRPSKFNFSNP